MFDGLLIQYLRVLIEELLANPHLTFEGKFDNGTGEVLLSKPMSAKVRGVSITLIPPVGIEVGRHLNYCEFKGSLHKYRNAGQHNADDFTAADLLAVLDDLVLRFGIDPFRSRLNSVEFGVNIELPFPVDYLITRLISYKGVPFILDIETGIYYQAKTEQYIVKVYDKGSQYRNDVPGLPANLLRVEVKVREMRYLTDKGIRLNTLADLLTVEYYPVLGAILSETFGTILFDEPTVTRDPPEGLKQRDRELLLQGWNSAYWQRSKGLPEKDRDREQKRRRRDEMRFRSLLDQYRAGRDWQTDVAELIRQKWVELSTVTTDTRAAVADRLTMWHEEFSESTTRGRTAENCPVYGGVSEQTGNRETVDEGTESVRFTAGTEKPEMSGLRTHSLGRKPDIVPTDDGAVNAVCGTSVEEGFVSQSNVEFSDSIKRGETPVEEVIRQADETTSQHLLNIASQYDLNIPLQSSEVVGPLDQSMRCCVVTGLDISHQRTTTRFVSTSTVRLWYDLGRATFDMLAGRFLTAKQAGADLDKQCYHIAHNIRNTYTNPRNNPIRPLKKYVVVTPGQTLPLFTPASTVQPTDRQLTALEHRRGTRWDIGL